MNIVCREKPNNISLKDETLEITYCELEAMIDVASEKLAKYNSICLLIDNNIECIVAYCACLRLNIPVYICNPNTNTVRTREICEYYGFDAIVKRQKSVSNETRNILDNLLIQKK